MANTNTSTITIKSGTEGTISSIPIPEDMLKSTTIKLDKNTIVSETPAINTEPEDYSQLSNYLGIDLDKDKLKDVSRKSVMDFVESHNLNNDLTPEEIDAMVNEIAGTVKLPEVITQNEELDDALGLKAEDLKQLYGYISGKEDKPLFLDKYLADSQNKLIDFQHVMTLIRLSTIPQLAAMQAMVQRALYSPEKLINVEAKDLAAMSSSLSSEMTNILNTANKSIEMINSVGRIDSRYRAIMDKLLVVPEETLNQIEHLLDNR